MPRKKQKKINKVIWANSDKTLLRVYYDDQSIEYVGADNNPQHKQVLKKFPLDEIEKETEAVNLWATTRANRFKDFSDNYEIWRGFWRGEKAAGADNSILDRILNVHESPQAFFKLKLSIFELKRVRENKNREWKASLRKAATGLELLALLYQEMPDLESELVLSEDETDLPETTNQENNVDSDPKTTDQTSDAPNE